MTARSLHLLPFSFASVLFVVSLCVCCAERVDDADESVVISPDLTNTGTFRTENLIVDNVSTLNGPSTLGTDTAGNTDPITINGQARFNSTFNQTALCIPALDTQRVGIGTCSPQEQLHIASDVESRFIMETNTASVSGSSEVEQWRSRGTNAAKTIVLAGDRLGHLGALGYDGTVFRHGADIVFKTETESTVGANRMPTSIYFETAPDGSPASVQSHLRIDSGGHAHFLGVAPVFSACGTTPVSVPVAEISDSTGGVTTGATATGCTVTFANVYFTRPPTCIVQIANTSRTFSYAVTQTTLTITFVTAVAGDTFHWICFGHKS